MNSLKNSESGKKLFTKKYLVFDLSQEKYGVILSSVKEVIGPSAITEIPQVPKYFKGIINLRGKIITVLDLRLRLGLKATPIEPKKTSIIISDISDYVVGLIVDNVHEVLAFDDICELSSSLEVFHSESREYIEGVAKTSNDKMILIINLDKVLGNDDKSIITKKAS